jgi:flagellar biosynthetic protein FliO
MEMMQQIAAVAAILALLLGVLWWLRKRGFAVPAFAGGRSPARRLECLERVALGPQQTLHLVRLGDRALLVAASPAGCSLLRDLAWRDLAVPGEDAE